MLKVKEWINENQKKPQFEVLERKDFRGNPNTGFPPMSAIITVSRLSDSAIFKTGDAVRYKERVYSIYSFEDDLIRARLAYNGLISGYVIPVNFFMDL